jgi:hypothetical protein
MLCLCKVDIVLTHFPLPSQDAPGEARDGRILCQRGLDPEAMYQRMKTLMDADQAWAMPDRDAQAVRHHHPVRCLACSAVR